MKWQANPYNRNLKADIGICSYHITEIKNGLYELRRRSRGVSELIGTFTGPNAINEARCVAVEWEITHAATYNT